MAWPSRPEPGIARTRTNAPSLERVGAGGNPLDIVKQLLAEQAGPLVEKLTGQLGFSAEQAQRFVPAAVAQLIEVVKGGGFDVAGLLGGGDPSALVDEVDTGALAQAAGLDATQATAGLQSIAPSILAKLGESAGGAQGLLSLLGGEGTGGLLGKASGLAGGLFKK
jgi:hypothetical protein